MRISLFNNSTVLRGGFCCSPNTTGDTEMKNTETALKELHTQVTDLGRISSVYSVMKYSVYVILLHLNTRKQIRFCEELYETFTFMFHIPRRVLNNLFSQF